MTNNERIYEEFFKLGFEITPIQVEQFGKYYEILVETNKVLNLTTITEFEDVLFKHFIDSVYLLKVFELPLESKIIDVGTGAGFPGIPLKIMRPDLKITLLDSLNKRLNFLKDVAKLLELEGLEFIHARAEDAGQNKLLREKFDFSVSRAVSQMNILLEYCIPFLKIDGIFIGYKSKKLTEELEDSKKALHVLNGICIDTISYPIQDHEHNYVMIRKTQKTGKSYPRNPGMAQKNPIK